MRRLMKNERLVLGVVFSFVMIATLSLTGCGVSDGGGNGSSLSSAKAITAFSFTSPAATGIVDENAKTISVTVPDGTDITDLIAIFTATGANVSVGTIVQVSGTTSNDFSSTVAYTVTATDSTTATYTVTVAVESGFAKAITAFSFTSPAATGTIDESAKTISVTVPYGTDVTALIATFTTTGTSVTVSATPQVSGITPNDFTSPVAYTVTAADSTTTVYTVIVAAAPNFAKALTAFSFTSPATTGIIDENAKTISVTVPYDTDVTTLIATFTTTGASVAVGADPQVSGTTQNNFSSVVTYTVTAADGTTADYTVTVTVAQSFEKAITTFSFTNPVATGIIDENAKTISVTVPFGTDVTAMIATFTSTGASVEVGATPQASGTTPNDFSSPVDYTVTAADSTTATYTVTVTPAAPSSEKAITTFSFTSPVATGIIDEGAKTISVTVPYLTDVSALVATFATTGVNVSVGATPQVSGTTPNNFASPAAYTVTAEDSTTAVYTVTVTVALSPAKAITAFSIASPAATGTIDEGAKTISVIVPFGTPDITALIATFSTTGASVDVGATPQVSGTTPNDFTSPVDYTVTAEDGTTAIYAVIVTIAQNDAKAITGFRFTNPVATGTIDENLKTISVTIPHVPHGTDVTALKATFTTSGASVSIGATPQVSGTTPNDFTGPVVYTVTAADASTVDYTVTVTRKAASEVFVPGAGNDTISVFDASVGGDVAALRRFGNVTGLSKPTGIAVDTVNNEIFVANEDNNSITAYIRTATGGMAPVRTIFGASTGLNHPTDIAVDTLNNEIVVVNFYGGGSIAVFDRSADGNVSPKRTFSTDSGPYSIAVDTVNNEIFVLYYFPTSIKAYDRLASGVGSPIRTITAGNTEFPQGIAVDTLNNELFVAMTNQNKITVYNRTDSGSASAKRSISGASTGLSYPTDIVVDTVNNQIFVTNGTLGNSITAYGRTANGNVSPVRTISGPGTGLNWPSSVAVDTVNIPNQIFVANSGNHSITVYERTDTGDETPTRTVSGASSGVIVPMSVAVDGVNNEIFVINESPVNSITVYGRTDNGTVVPLRTISGGSTGLNNPYGIAVDTVNDEILVINRSSGSSVTVYGRKDKGDAAPVRTISGGNTDLIWSNGIAVDPVNDQIFVTHNNDSVTVYGRTDNGDVAPARTISGASTGLDMPWGIAVDTLNNEILVANKFNANTITVFGRTANGDAPYLRRITGLSDPRGVAVDTVNNLIFVSNAGNNNNSVAVYGRTDDGSIAPLRTIFGTSTGISDPYGIALW